MVDPGSALIVFLALALALAAVAWPRRGVAARLGRMLEHTARIRSEDALKHAYHCENAGRPATIDSLAGAMDVLRVGRMQKTSAV